MDEIWRSLGVERRSTSETLRHRDMVRLAVRSYHGVQTAWIVIGMIAAVKPTPDSSWLWRTPTVAPAHCSPISGHCPDGRFGFDDFDETGMTPMINSLVASSTVAST